MTARTAEGRARHKYIPLSEKVGVGSWEKDTRPKQDKKFQRAMYAAGYEPRVVTDPGTDMARSANVYTVASCQSSAGW